MSEMVIVESDSQEVEVWLEGETLWLTQKQMGELFGTTPKNVLMHLKNIFKGNELDEAATAKDFLAVCQEGKRQVKRRLKHYNLDAIISVGFWVNSTRATRFVPISKDKNFRPESGVNKGAWCALFGAPFIVCVRVFSLNRESVPYANKQRHPRFPAPRAAHPRWA